VVQVSQALNPRRISRTLVTVLGLTLIQTVLPPVLAPQISTPTANAITNTYSPAQATEWLVPANVTQISVTIKGGSGGVGGQDCGAGCNNQAGGPRGSFSYTFTVTTGDVIGIYPGYKGANGLNSTNSGGGAAGADTSPNGTFDGGSGGGAGSGGFSGAGGGGGAASILLINSVLRAVAGGAGGGGGAANVAGSGRVGSEYSSGSLNGASFTGGAGGTTSACTTTSGGSTNDGGGSGGSGGGYYGGAAMPVYAASAGECAGNGGMRGGNYVFTNDGTAVIGNSGVAQGSETVANTDGSIVIDYTPASISACTETPQTVDIYRVIKLSASGSCTWTVPAGVTTIDLFAVGGGGAGGSFGGSGGGGGAAISRTALPVTAATNLTLKIGYGGGASFTDGWSGGNGDSTTISFPSGLFLAANGGSMGVKGDGSNTKVGGVGGTAVNGGFAGGAGGVSATTVNTRGAVGKTGISNYFTGSVAEYGGGGGGGTHKNACTPLDGQLGSSGGAAGASCNSNVNSAGGSALAETGGGGGGGGYGTSGNTLGGKGGSGVIYVRYAINTADAFPVSLTSALAARYSPGDLQLLDATRKGWIDSTGTNATTSTGSVVGSPTITTRGTTDGANLTDSSKTLLVAKGTTADRITLNNLPANYTMFHIARYVTGGTNGRVITTSTGNWISGHYNGANGCAHHNYWLSSGSCNTVNLYGWQLATDQLQYFRNNGLDVTLERSDNNGGTNYINAQSISNTIGINNDGNAQYSNWEFADMLIFNRILTSGEIRAIESWLARVNGLKLNTASVSSETDTAATFNGNFFRGQYGSGMYINDTFTVEGWLKPAATCDGGTTCSIFSYENVLVLKVSGGTFHYALYGYNSGWSWIDTGVKFPSGEWHHFALTKRLTYNRANAVDLHIDGNLAYTNSGSPYLNSGATNTTTDVVNTYDTWWYIGARIDATRYYGALDEFKLWKVARTSAEIAGDMHSSATTDKSLQLYYDFNKDSLSSTTDLQNLAWGGHARGDLTCYDTMAYEDVKVRTISGGHTVLTFPRTYINQYGGWKKPDSVTAASVLVVGGGGGGAGQYTSQTGQNGGGGGGGGVFEIGSYPLASSTYIPILVGTGGLGGPPSSTQENPYGRRGGTTSFNSSLTAGGGGGGTFTSFNQMNGAAGTAGGAGGGSTGYWNAFDQGLGGAGSSITVGSTTYAGRTGGNGQIWTGSNSGAGGGAGGNATATAPGAGITSSYSGTAREYGRGGTSEAVSTPAWVATPIAPGNGGDGYRSTNLNGGYGVRGANGVVVIRYITAIKPAFTPPVNAYLNVGMTETFTTNIAIDSATVGLTRTFRWESTTAGSGGTYTTIKQGTGATNAAFSWIPSDTSTTGSQYLYRVIVTDSDTAGLFIVDTSTAVYAVINGTLSMTGVNSIKKQINVARNETFTITSGTPTYRYTLLPAIPGITLDTSTVGSAVLKISDTASAGTYLETLTVIDSVSAKVEIPLSITISAPPSLVNYSEIETNDLVFNIDMSNSASYSRAAGTISDISGTKKPVTIVGGSTFSEDYSGNLRLSSSQYISATGFGTLSSFTIEAYINLQSISSSQVCIFGAEQSPTNVPYFLCIDTSRTVFTGFYNGQWTYKRTSQTLTLGAWTHVVGVFDSTTAGAKVELYINGVATTLSDSAQNATLVPPASSTDRVFINKWFWTSTAPSSAMDIGFIRLYRAPLGQAKVLQNYNATKDRFVVSNINQLKPSQKYGTLNLESFTVTSGGDTKTVSFAVGNRTGITWDTSTAAGRISLSVQESLTPGIYYDTITVTDNFGQSTTLPIKFTVSKADTITVTAGAATTQVYNTSPATAIPNFTISGLVSSDTGTVQRKYTGVDWTKTCAQGGGCEVGDTGPGGGTIFYVSPTAINAATGISTGGKYLEVAPLNWSGLSVESTTAWAKATTSVTGTLATLGSGAENTRLINNALTTNSVAAKVAADLVLNGKSDWFLPSTLEVKEMYDALYAAGLAGNLSVANYWSSTQGSTTSQAETYWFGNGGLVSPTNKLQSYTLRPIRAYSPDTITVTTVPTNVDSYTVTVDTPTLTVGSLANYENVIYQISGLDITKARQNPLTVSSYVANFGSPYTLTLLGGSGTGAVTESLTAGSTATGCTLNGHVITTTTAGTCVLQAKKAYSRNYFAETITATLYFLVWAINQPTNQSGGGATIGLNGPTAIIRDPNVAPTISSLSVYTGQAGVTQLVITGAGFNSPDAASTTVKFWRNKVASGFTISGDGTQITVTIPVGATTGKVTVTTPNGIAVSEFPITITL
jgi:hypothetical protein